MHDFLIALVFVSLVASPALAAILPQGRMEEDEEALEPENVVPTITASHA